MQCSGSIGFYNYGRTHKARDGKPSVDGGLISVFWCQLEGEDCRGGVYNAGDKHYIDKLSKV